MHGRILLVDLSLSKFALPVSPGEASSPDKYLNRRIAFTIVNFLLTIVYIALLTFTDLKLPFLRFASLSSNIYIAFLLFAFGIEILFSVVKFPYDYFSEFVTEHSFKLSTQTFSRWFFRKLKGSLVGSILGVIVLLAFYFLLVHFTENWWLLFAIFLFVFQVLVARLFPAIILPMFYKLQLISNTELHDRLNLLVEKFGYKMNGVFSFDLSRETRKANAALTGLGRSRKIIISDTLLETFSNDEIEVVLAHELGHLVKRHMIKGIVLSGAVSLVGIFIMARLYSVYAAVLSVPVFNLSAIPFLALLMTLFGIIAMPIGNFFSRKIEREADLFALDTTGMRKEFASSMTKLGKLNLVPENPPSWIEKFFFSHPSIGSRIKAALPVEENGAGIKSNVASLQ